MKQYLGLALVSLSLLTATSARADRCPAVMLLLDKSLSMDSDPSGDYSGSPSKMDIAKKALSDVVKKYGNYLPIGFATYSNDSSSDCWGDIDVLVGAENGKSAQVLSYIAAVTTTGLTNTGNALSKVSEHATLNDATRPGSYIILLTDGEPNCGDNSLDDPDYTIKVVGDVAAKGIKTFVIGFGALPTDAATTMDSMAVNSTVPCTDTSCGGHKFYAAEDQAGLDAVIEAISQKIAGEFGGTCDDSCYANGCPNDGEACVQGTCKPNPCANFTTCAPGSYCYWDGVSSEGTCKKSCKTPCGASQICNNGTCTDDPCATLSCDSGQTCSNGACVNDKCASEGCPPGLLCIGGSCKDDACRYVTCPTGTTCKNGTGQCIAPGTGTGGSGHGGSGHGRASVGGCVAGASGALDVFGLMIAAGLGALLLRRRQRA